MFWKTRAQTLDLHGMVWGHDTHVNLSNAEERERTTWQCINNCEAHCTHDEREAVAQELGKRLGIDYDVLTASRILSLMTPSEIAHLAASGIDIQLHTHRHRLPADDRDASVREISDNRRALEPLAGRRLEHFCYPAGKWNAVHWPWLEEMGIASATSCLEGMNDVSTPRLCLRRFLDSEDVADIEFEAELVGLWNWHDGRRALCARRG